MNWGGGVWRGWDDTGVVRGGGWEASTSGARGGGA